MDRPILSESILTLGVVPVADYALPGTNEVPDSIIPYVTNYNAVLLANHGLLTWGADITQAMYRMESAEHYAKIMAYLRQIGEPKEFSCSEVDELISIRKKLGIEAGGVPPCVVTSDRERPEAAGYSQDQIEKIVQEAVRRTISGS
jgi:L-fuculose-phosphate aldolase